MIVTKRDYNGLPDDQVAALEAVSQAVVNALLASGNQLFDLLGKEKDFGDLDYTIRVDTVEVLAEEEERNPVGVYKRLRFTDHSSGWWGILQWREGRYSTFCWYARNDYVPDGDPDWGQFHDDWTYDRCSIYGQATRSIDRESWYCPSHKIDFQHPFIRMLDLAASELRQGRIT